MIKAIFIQKGQRKNEYYNLGEYSFLYRSNVKEIISVMFKTVSADLQPKETERMSLYNHSKIENAYLVIYQNNESNILTVCSDQINRRALRDFLRRLEEKKDEKSETKEIETFINDYKKLSEDKLDVINKQLDDVKKIMVQNIDLAMQRGESLEVLMAKSQDLSESSKIFLKKSRDLNSCCVIL
jgi:hypothetical protein